MTRAAALAKLTRGRDATSFSASLTALTRLFFIDERAEGHLEAGDWQALAHDPQARFLLLRRGRVLARGRDPMCIAWHARRELSLGAEDTPVFLGLLDGRPCFGLVPHEPPLTAADRLGTGYGVDEAGFVGLYDAAMGMTAVEARLAARAVHFANWINRTRYCGVCGAPMRAAAAGHRRICTGPECAREEFPRIDPVVIALVVRGSRCLLGRQPRFPPRRYSAVAGFVEPGETLEAAVRREVQEEVGAALAQVRYIGSQPWPFPSSLMVGFLAEARGETISLNDRELEDARWFTRAQLEEALHAERAGSEAELTLPPAGSIARRLIEHWLAAPPMPAGGG